MGNAHELIAALGRGRQSGVSLARSMIDFKSSHDTSGVGTPRMFIAQLSKSSGVEKLFALRSDATGFAGMC